MVLQSHEQWRACTCAHTHDDMLRRRACPSYAASKQHVHVFWLLGMAHAPSNIPQLTRKRQWPQQPVSKGLYLRQCTMPCQLPSLFCLLAGETPTWLEGALSGTAPALLLKSVGMQLGAGLCRSWGSAWPWGPRRISGRSTERVLEAVWTVPQAFSEQRVSTLKRPRRMR